MFNFKIQLPFVQAFYLQERKEKVGNTRTRKSISGKIDQID